jgi:hypothetical protein
MIAQASTDVAAGCRTLAAEFEDFAELAPDLWRVEVAKQFLGGQTGVREGGVARATSAPQSANGTTPRRCRSSCDRSARAVLQKHGCAISANVRRFGLL